MDTNANSKKRMIIIGAVAAVVIIAALVTIIILLMNPKPATATAGNEARGTVVTPENIDQLREEASQSVEAGYYATRMNVEWNFKTSKTPSSNAYVANPEYNSHTVYFDVILEDSGELVYSSPFIPVGAELRDFALDASIKDGTYPATVVYHLVDDDENELSTVSVKVTLHIGA